MAKMVYAFGAIKVSGYLSQKYCKTKEVHLVRLGGKGWTGKMQHQNQPCRFKAGIKNRTFSNAM